MALTDIPLDVDTRTEALRHLVRRVQAEYEEMPALSVTLPQAQRLWGVDRESIGVVTVPEDAVEPLRADEVLSVRPMAVAG